MNRTKLMKSVVFFCVGGIAAVVCAGGSNEKQVTLRGQGKGDQNLATNTESQWIPRLPQWQGVKFSKPEKVFPNKPFELSVTYESQLFDISELSLTLRSAGKDIKIVGGETEWKGTLKKGESKTLKCEVIALNRGLSGRCALEVSTPSVFALLHTHADAMDASTYNGREEKKYLESWLAHREKKGPIYTETFDCLVRTETHEEK